MGYASYTIQRNGETIDAGYDIETTREEPGCDTRIDRGLGYLCGETPGGDEYGCGGYYCGSHLYGDTDTGGCTRCRERQTRSRDERLST